MTTYNGHDSPNSIRTTIPDKQPVRHSPPRPRKQRSSVWLWFGFFLIVLAAIVVIVLFHRSQAESNLNTSTQEMAVPTVLVVHPQKGDAEVHLILPGTVSPLIQSSVYAQVSGYIK